MRKLRSKRKIIIVLPNDDLGGAEQILKMIANHLKNEAVIVKFLTKKKSNSWESLNQQVTLSYSTYNSEYIGAVILVFSLIFKAKKERFQYIFTSHVFVTGLIGILIRFQIIKKAFFIGRESTLIFKRFRGFKLLLYKLMYLLGYPALDLLICQTDRMKEELLCALPNLNKRTKIVVIPNPIDLDDISHKSIMQIQKNYGSFIVSAGRLIPEKGFDILICAFEKLKRKYDELKLIILGEGNERIHLEELILKNNLEEEVVLLGFVSNVYPFFKAAKLCVVSSRIEGFPNVLLQMMSQNDKVVSTTCAGGIKDIPGLIIADADNQESLEDALTKAFETDTIINTEIFERFLCGRDISIFIAKVENYLKK